MKKLKLKAVFQIKKLEIKHIKVNTFYLSEKIKDFISSKNFGLEINIIDDGREILDTGGGLLNICLLYTSDAADE